MLVLCQEGWLRRGNHLLHVQPEMREAGELLRAMNADESIDGGSKSLVRVARVSHWEAHCVFDPLSC